MLSSLRLKDSFTVYSATHRHTPTTAESTAIFYCWSSDTVSHLHNSWISGSLLLLIQRHTVTPPQQLNQRQFFTVYPATQSHTSTTAESTAVFYFWSSNTMSHPHSSWINSNLLLFIQRHTVVSPQQLNQEQSFTVYPATQCHTSTAAESTAIFYCLSSDTVSHPHNSWINSNLLLLIQRHSVTPPQQLNQKQSFTVDPATQRHTPTIAELTAVFYCWSSGTPSHHQNSWINSSLLLLIHRHSVTPP